MPVMPQAQVGDLDAARTQHELDSMRAQLVESTAALASASQEAARLRHALIDAEVDTQRSSVAAEGAAAKVRAAEEEAARLRGQLAAASAELEAERARTFAARQAMQARAAEASEACAQAAAADARAAAAQAACAGCRERDTWLEGERCTVSQQAGHIADLEGALEDERRHSQVGHVAS